MPQPCYLIEDCEYSHPFLVATESNSSLETQGPGEDRVIASFASSPWTHTTRFVLQSPKVLLAAGRHLQEELVPKRERRSTCRYPPSTVARRSRVRFCPIGDFSPTSRYSVYKCVPPPHLSGPGKPDRPAGLGSLPLPGSSTKSSPSRYLVRTSASS